MTTPGTGELQSSPHYGSYDESPSAAEGPAGGPAGSRDCTPDHGQAAGFDGILRDIQELRKNQSQVEECLENLRASYQRVSSSILEALEEEQCRWELLEERLIDMTDLCQNDISNLKEELVTKEEKMARQSYDTTADFHEALEVCETRLFKLEQQQQEEVQPERWADTTELALLGKLINVPLAIMDALLVLMSMVTNCVVIFVKTPCRTLCTLLFVILLSLLWRHREVILDYHCLYFCTQRPGKDK